MKLRVPNRFQPERLTQARLAKKWNMAELAERVGVTRQAISGFESGDSAPGPETLRKLANSLEVPELFFATPLREAEDGLQSAINFRTLAAAVKRARDQAKTYLEWLASLTAFATEFAELPPVSLPKFDIPDFARLTDERIEELAQETRRFFGLGDGPISDLTLLLENKGVVVGCVPLDAGMDGLSAWYAGRPMVLISSKAYYARSRFDLAHELAHLLLHRAVSPDDLEEKEILHLVESQAHRFASAFLMPAATFVNEVYSTDMKSLIELKRRWGVSIQAIMVRLHDLLIISEWQKIRFFKMLSAIGMRKKEPLDGEREPERPLLTRRIREFLDTEKIVLSSEFVARTRLPPSFVMVAGNLPEEAAASVIPSARVLDFSKALASKRGDGA